MKLLPSRLVLRASFFLVAGFAAGAFFSLAMILFLLRDLLKNQLLFGGLEIVVVPELTPGDDLLHGLDALGRLEAVHLQLALQPLHVEIGYLARHRIDAEALDFAADIDGAVIHGIAEILAGIPQYDHAAALHHEAAEGSRPAADDDGAALHVDAHAGTDIAHADEIAPAHGGAEGGARVLLDHHGPRHHVLCAGPADAALYADVRPVDQAAAEIAEAALDMEVQAVQDADGERMLGAGVLHDHRAVALAHQLAQLEVDLPAIQIGGVELRPLVEIDLEGVRIGEALLLHGREEALLGAPGKLLGMHPHLGGFGPECHSLSRLLKSAKRQLCQTRTSPS